MRLLATLSQAEHLKTAPSSGGLLDAYEFYLSARGKHRHNQVLLGAAEELQHLLGDLLIVVCGSPTFTNVGRFRSSLVSPFSSRRLTSPVSPSALRSWYSVRFTKGTSTLWDVGHRSWYFLPVKMSKATI